MRLRPPADRYRRRALFGVLACLALLGAVTTAVATGVTDSLDVWVREWFRPDLMWGPNQQRASHVTSWLAPDRMVMVLALGSAVVGAWRWTAWPLVRSAAAVALTGGLTLALKVLVDRPDPRGEHTSLGGSYPSGHTAILLVCVATGAMLVSCPTRWWQRVGLLLPIAVLAVAMLYDAFHWFTDIVGGTLVAGVVLAAQALLAGPGGGRSHRNRRPRRTRPQDRSSSLESVPTEASSVLSGGSPDVHHRP
jgi:membrane-associated phospholipid phosphatase